MASRQFLLPDVGEGLTEAEIVRWHVAPGDLVEVNQPLADIETAKAVVELPSPYTGRVIDLLVPVGRVVPVGTPIVSVDVEDARDEPQALLVGYGTSHPVGASRRRRSAAAPSSIGTASSSRAHGGVLAKPPVRQMAVRLGIDLAQVAGSGPGGIVTRDDVQRALGAGSANGRAHESPIADLPGDTRTAASAVHRAMAGAMTRSALTVPQATVWLDVDVTAAFARLTALRSDPEFAGIAVTPMLAVADALLRAVRKHPECLSVWDARTDELVQRAAVNLGIAVASPRGLIVPNIKGAESLGLRQLAEAIADLTATARAGSTSPADMTGGTLTITNVGVFGVDGGMPILNPGESVILAVGRAVARPWVADGDLVVRTVMQVALSFDHRALDGRSACLLLAAIGSALEDPEVEVR